MGDITRKEGNAGASAGALVPNYFALCVGDWGFFVGLPSLFDFFPATMQIRYKRTHSYLPERLFPKLFLNLHQIVVSEN